MKNTSKNLFAFLLIIIELSFNADLKAQVITTFAGTGVYGFSGDGGAAAAATLRHPIHMDVDAGGNLYIADWVNNRIRKVTPAGIITTVAGSGTGGSSTGDGGPATAAKLYAPVGVKTDTAGNIYIVECFGNHVRKITPSGIINTIAGIGTIGNSGDGGPATAAQFSQPWGVAIDKTGNVYVADVNNHNVRRINSSGIISTIAGTGVAGFTGDGGSATAAQLNKPYDIVFDTSGNLYIADQFNNRIRKVTPSGTISTVAGGGTSGLGDGGAATAGQLSGPTGLAIDKCGNLLIADQANESIRKVSSAGIITTIAGCGVYGSDGDGAAATLAKLSAPQGVAVDVNGAVYIADTDSNRVRRVVFSAGCGTAFLEDVHISSTVAITISPNPNKGAFTIDLSSAQNEEATITLTNILGQKVKELTISTNKQVGVQLNVPSGIYIVSAILAGERLSARLTVE